MTMSALLWAIALLAAQSQTYQQARPVEQPAKPSEKAQARSQTQSPLTIEIADPSRGTVPSDEAGGYLYLGGSLLGGDKLKFLTCENVLDGNTDFGLYPLRLRREDWRSAPDGSLEFRAPAGEGIELFFQARAEGASIALLYEISNKREQVLEYTHVGPCLRTEDAPLFHPGSGAEVLGGAEGRKARVGKNDWSELYQRICLWNDDKPFYFSDSKLAKSEKHLAFLRQGATPIDWNWWVNDSLAFDEPVLALFSKDKQRVLVMAFERSDWASSNVGDGRACVHLFPSLGRIKPGESAAVRGRIHVALGDAQAAKQQTLQELHAKPK